eukprot:364747-Chlamydomonas_euryale.AAC.2
MFAAADTSVLRKNRGPGPPAFATAGFCNSWVPQQLGSATAKSSKQNARPPPTRRIAPSPVPTTVQLQVKATGRAGGTRKRACGMHGHTAGRAGTQRDARAYSGTRRRDAQVCRRGPCRRDVQAGHRDARECLLCEVVSTLGDGELGAAQPVVLHSAPQVEE